MLKIYLLNIKCLRKNFNKILVGMSKTRQDKVLSFRLPEDQLRSLGAGVLLNYALNLLGYQEKNLKVAFNEFGKPYYPNLPNFHFNLSHSGKYVVLATDDKEVGIDIQKVVKGKEKAISKVLNEKELETLRNKKTKDYVRLWTYKESYVKYLGLGLNKDIKNIDLNNIDVNFKEYHVYGYQLTVCSKSNDFPRKYKKISTK